MTEMLDKVKKVGRGNFDVLPVSAEIVEIEELDQGINKMAHRISGLLENVRQEKEMQHLTELQLIQAQVNPHFLYNTLDTIVWLIEGGMTDDAVEMISSLSIFFRTSLSKGNDIIPLSEEKRHTLSYLEIQQFRYRDILEFELSIPKELDGVQVPKLSIQPLAENALYHGIKNRRGKGKITITGRKKRMQSFLLSTITVRECHRRDFMKCRKRYAQENGPDSGLRQLRNVLLCTTDRATE